MGKEDHLTRQINQLAFFLRKIAEKLTGTKNGNELSETVSVVNFKLNEQLGFDLAIFDAISDDAIVEFLIKREGFNHANIELFADILVGIDNDKYAKKALLIYHYVNQVTATFSFDRDLKIKKSIEVLHNLII